MQRCLFCGSAIDPTVPRIREGGRVSFCSHCLGRLEDGGFLRTYEDNTVTLNRPIFEAIASYSSL